MRSQHGRTAKPDTAMRFPRVSSLNPSIWRQRVSNCRPCSTALWISTVRVHVWYSRVLVRALDAVEYTPVFRICAVHGWILPKKNNKPGAKCERAQSGRGRRAFSSSEERALQHLSPGSPELPGCHQAVLHWQVRACLPPCAPECFIEIAA